MKRTLGFKKEPFGPATHPFTLDHKTGRYSEQPLVNGVSLPPSCRFESQENHNFKDHHPHRLISQSVDMYR
jgi:hypothetical protein